ncbi:MAG: hypothetical protein AAF657_09540 [Acidobacteriota bacterium]
MSRPSIIQRLLQLSTAALFLVVLTGCSQPAEEPPAPSTEAPSEAAAGSNEPQFADGFESNSTDEWSETKDADTKQSAEGSE